MTLNLTIPQTMHTDFTPKITVIGVGGGGTNAVDNMIALNLQGVEFVVANTDAQQLMHSRADRRIQLGPHITQGLGAGAKPEIGRAAAEEAADELYHQLNDTHMVFITAGMGGGTGTGAAPVIARMARERNVLTVGVVTKPFTFEGSRRARAAEQGIEELQQYVDTLIVIPNQNLFRLANERTGWKEAFKMADHVLYMGVRGVTDLMMAPGLVNLDFADIRTVMAEMGKAMMGTGEAEGENRAIRAAEAAISNPLLEDTSMSGARGLLINITGGEDMTLYEVDQAANRIREEVDEEANIIFGSAIDDDLVGKVRVSVVATGIESAAEIEARRPRLVAVGGGGGMLAAAPIVGEHAAEPVESGTVTALQPGVGGPAPGLGATGAMLPAAGPGSVGPVSIGPRPLGRSPLPPLRQPLTPRPTELRTAPPAAVPAASPPVAAVPPGGRPGSAETPPSRGLFAEPPRSAAPRPPTAAPAAPPARSSLFNIVTGAMRRGRGSATEIDAAPIDLPRAAPAEEAELPPEPSRPTVRPAAADESGLDIPAFLRRQSS